MTVETDNVAILKRAYEDWDKSKGAGTDYLIAVFHNDVQFTSLADGAPDAVAFTSARKGKEDFLAYIDGLTRDWEMIFYRVDDYVAQGDRVVAIGSTSWRNKKTRKVVTTRKVDIWRMKNGKAIEFSEYYDTAKLLAAAQP
jgi:ketosteroid isomerase-like protein